MSKINNNIIEGHSGKGCESALANRPLPNISSCSSCVDKSKNDLSLVKPYYGSKGNYGENNSYGYYAIGGLGGLGLVDNYTSEKSDIPVVIQKSRDQYIVLENEVGNETDLYNIDSINDNWTDLSYTSSNKNEKPKMDFITTFYIGSISIVALFIVFRVTQGQGNR
jgi:hypothetical protein